MDWRYVLGDHPSKPLVNDGAFPHFLSILSIRQSKATIANSLGRQYPYYPKMNFSLMSLHSHFSSSARFYLHGYSLAIFTFIESSSINNLTAAYLLME